MLGDEREEQKSFEDLPFELIENILDKVSAYQDFAHCALVCRRWNQAISNVNKKRRYALRKALINFNVQWKKCEETPQIPPRYSHSACVIDNAMYVFGGCTSFFTTFNDLLRFDLATHTWSRPVTKHLALFDGYPRPKAGASLIADERDKRLILFGGWTPEPYSSLRDWIVLEELHIGILDNDGSSVNWIVAPFSPTPRCPPPTAGHGVTVHDRTMVMFGGVTTGSNFNCLSTHEVWCLNMDSYMWHKAFTKGPYPPPRYQHSQLKIDDEHLLIIGGCGGPNQLYNDCWLLTMSSHSQWHWKLLEVNNQDYRAPQLWCYPACKIGDLAVVVGQSTGNMATSSSSIVPFSFSVAELPAVPRSRPPPIELDSNVNGRRGSLYRLIPPPKSVRPGPAGLAAFRDIQSVITQQRRQPLPTRRRTTTTNWPRAALYVLDISKALTQGSVSWIKPPNGLPQNCCRNIEQKMLYSLVAGRGELILFGGIRKDPRGVENNEETIKDSLASSTVHILQAPL